MPAKLAVLALLIALGALAVAVAAVPGRERHGALIDQRLADVEQRLVRLEQATTDSRTGSGENPTLLGRAPWPLAGTGPSGPAPSAPSGSAPTSRSAPTGRGTGPGSDAEQDIQDLVERAVDRKALQIQAMANKKPTLELFAETVGLSEEQRQVVEEEVLRAQREIRAVLEIPAADGTSFVDELVEVLAEGMARPGERPERGMRFFGRLLTENVPGTSETYAQRAEAAKEVLRDVLRRELTPEQHALFESWQMDPTEIQGIENSPWEDVGRRAFERAKDLGAQVPGEGK